MRRLAASILALAFLVMSAVPALGAIDQDKVKEFKALHQELYSIKAQIIDKKVDMGVLDQAKAEKIKNVMQKRHERIQQDIDKGEFDFKHKKGHGQKHSPDSPSPQKQ